MKQLLVLAAALLVGATLIVVLVWREVYAPTEVKAPAERRYDSDIEGTWKVEGHPAKVRHCVITRIDGTRHVAFARLGRGDSPTPLVELTYDPAEPHKVVLSERAGKDVVGTFKKGTFRVTIRFPAIGLVLTRVDHEVDSDVREAANEMKAKHPQPPANEKEAVP